MAKYRRKKVSEAAEKRITVVQDSVNSVAGRVRGLWLGYLTLGTYLFIAIGSVTHKQLFLETPIRLPILNVDLPLIGFFAIAPLFFLVNHFYLLLTLLSLGRRIREYNVALASESLATGTETGVRRKLDSFVIVLALAGTEEERKGRTSIMLRLIAWLTVVGAPVVLLLFTQLTFLPYHKAWVTWLHRGTVIADLALLWVFWPAIRKGAEKLPVAWPIRKPIVAANSAFVAVFSLMVATFPGERWDQNPMATVSWVPFWLEDRAQERHVNGSSLYKLLFLGDVERVTGTRKSLWSNTLVLPGRDDLVDDKVLSDILQRAKSEGKQPWQSERMGRFQGRDLRGAVLSRADIRNMDFLGAQLQGADLSWARIQGADLSGTQMQGADLFGAEMHGANLREARMQGADISWAQMQGVNLSGTRMQGANISWAQMQGADLSWAQMQGADLSSAQMQGVNLREAQIQVANLREARMQGADLGRARMQGADLGRAQMQGANLSGARIWQIQPPGPNQIEHADLDGIRLSPYYPQDSKAVLKALSTDAARNNVERRFRPFLDAAAVADWTTSPNLQTWGELSGPPRSGPAATARFLAELGCQDKTEGAYLIKGIARRIAGFYGREREYAKEAARLIGKETCSAARHLGDETLARLKNVAGRLPNDPQPAPSAHGRRGQQHGLPGQAR